MREWNNTLDYVVAHTSGSTGAPKEVRLLKSDMRRSAEATCRFFGITEESLLVLPLSTDYIAGKMMVVRSIVSGAKLIQERPSAEPLNENNYGTVSLTAVVPSQVEGLLRSKNQIQKVIIGGGQISPEIEKEILESPIHAYATYGMTETCSHVALRDITQHQEYFTALPGISLETDSRGCLVINAPDFSFKRLITNDIVNLLDSRRFVWVGRADNVINSGGIKLHPEQIETQLSTIIPYPFYIVGRPSSRWGEEAVLYIEADDSKINKDDIIEKARCVLNRYSVPKEVLCTEKFQRTESGKIKRILL